MNNDLEVRAASESGGACLTVRENTERPATIEHGTNRLVGSDPQGRLPELWDGNAAGRIVDVLRKHI